MLYIYIKLTCPSYNVDKTVYNFKGNLKEKWTDCVPITADHDQAARMCRLIMTCTDPMGGICYATLEDLKPNK
jgi:hypothetical protein